MIASSAVAIGGRPDAETATAPSPARLAPSVERMITPPLVRVKLVRGALVHGAPVRPDTDFVRFVQALALRQPGVPAATLHRWARGYGSRVPMLAAEAGLGAEVAPGLFEAELVYLHRHEWARSADDVLWRRSKLGLHLSAEQRASVAAWCAARSSGV